MEIRNLGLGDKTQRGLAYSKLSMDNSSINWYSMYQVVWYHVIWGPSFISSNNTRIINMAYLESCVGNR